MSHPFRVRRPFILTLSGYARTGKDATVAALRELVPDVARVAFADPVREFARDFYGIGDGTEEWWTGEVKNDLLLFYDVGETVSAAVARGVDKRYGVDAITLRDLLIHIGMGMRARVPTFWLDQGEGAAEDALRGGAQIVVVTDARFPNEVERFAQKLFTERWHITRPGATPQGSADREVDLINRAMFTFGLNNDGDLAQLKARIAEALTDTGKLIAEE